jgi:hypothetical protein
MKLDQELKIQNELLHVWANVYLFREKLGKNHELYNAFDKLTRDINDVECLLIDYIEKVRCY